MPLLDCYGCLKAEFLEIPQNNFERFLNQVQEDGEIIILKDGVEVARLVVKEKKQPFLSNRLLRVLSSDVDEKAARAERMSQYESPC